MEGKGFGSNDNNAPPPSRGFDWHAAPSFSLEEEDRNPYNLMQRKRDEPPSQKPVHAEAKKRSIFDPEVRREGNLEPRRLFQDPPNGPTSDDIGKLTDAVQQMAIANSKLITENRDVEAQLKIILHASDQKDQRIKELEAENLRLKQEVSRQQSFVKGLRGEVSRLEAEEKTRQEALSQKIKQPSIFQRAAAIEQQLDLKPANPKPAVQQSVPQQKQMQVPQVHQDPRAMFEWNTISRENKVSSAAQTTVPVPTTTVQTTILRAPPFVEQTKIHVPQEFKVQQQEQSVQVKQKQDTDKAIAEANKVLEMMGIKKL